MLAIILASSKYCRSFKVLFSFLDTVHAKGILDILNETDNSTDDELLEYAMTLINKVNKLIDIYIKK